MSCDLIKERHCSKINGRTCVDSSTQRGNIPRDYASSPTTSFEALMNTLVVDAYKFCDVVLFDVPGVYLNADIPN